MTEGFCTLLTYKLVDHILLLWLVVWLPFFFFHLNWVSNYPNWLSYFSEGWLNHQPVLVAATWETSPNSPQVIVYKPFPNGWFMTFFGTHRSRCHRTWKYCWMGFVHTGRIQLFPGRDGVGGSFSTSRHAARVDSPSSPPMWGFLHPTFCFDMFIRGFP